MTGNLACSVVVPTYNRSELLRLTLASLVAQSIGTAAFEVLVCDDGSSDDTADVVESFRDHLDLHYRHQPDEGYRAGQARNLGIADARGDVCVMVDAGVILHSQALRAHLDSHRLSPTPVAVVGYVYCFNENNEDAAQIAREVDPADPDTAIAAMREQGRWLDIREAYYAKYTDDFGDLPAPWVLFWGCNISARTDRLRDVGMFDEAFHAWGGEDGELGYRLWRSGARLVLNREAAAIHWPHAKDYSQNMVDAAANYRYFAAKAGTPITQLATNQHFLELNDVARERGLPSDEDFLSGRSSNLVVVFSPHPDDEVIACGGTIIKRIAEGHQVKIVFSTDGAMSHQAVLGLDEPSPADLVEIRTKESLAAAAAMGVAAGDVHFLKFPDTQLVDHQPAFRAAVSEFLAANTDVVEVFLPHDVLEMHADHRLTGENVLRSLKDAGLVPLVRKYVVWDEEAEREFDFTNREPASLTADATERVVDHDIAEHLDRKLAALREHRTQVELYTPAQTRPVVPESFVQRVCARPVESFWTVTA
ncbi:PIG-L family deacetylase [Micromonosporaceae bacterium Da 78-11]